VSSTLCAKLRCNPEALVDLSKTFNIGYASASFGSTAYARAKHYYAPLASEINKENKDVTHQIRKYFSMIVNDLTTLETNEETIAEEYPDALEFKGWASDDCIEFCNSHGLIDDLRKCRKALNGIFSNINKSNAEIDHYQEIDVDDESYVVLRLEIKSDRQTYRKEYKSLVNWMVHNLSDENRILISVAIDRL